MATKTLEISDYFTDIKAHSDGQSFVERELGPSDIKYGIIGFTKGQRALFPNYKQQFVLTAQGKPYVAHVTSNKFENDVPAEIAGAYIGHPKAKDIDSLLAEIIPNATDTNLGTLHELYRQMDLVIGDRIRITEDKTENGIAYMKFDLVRE